MDSGKKIESVHLWTSSQSLWIETPDKSLPIVAISRDWNPEITLTNHAAIPSGATKKSVYGILGIIHLPLTKFLVTVVQKRKVGDLDGHAIFRLESVEFIPISSMQASSSTEVDGEKRCYQLIHEALSTPYFYFTYTGDLTNSQQRQAQSNSNSSWENADKRFLWNYSMANNLMSYVSSGSSKSDIYPFLLQLIHGAVFIHRCSINGKSFNWGLISRRSRFQTGTRFFARGTDKQGNVANYCETEQLVEFEGQLASYVQTRGSMPFFWSQMPCVKYMPKPKVIGSDHDNKSVMTAHFEEQTSVYGEQVIINLINQKKNEGTLEQMFRQLMSNLKMDNVHYEAFDFHKECSKMRYDRLILLRNQISQYVFGYFQKSGSSVSTTQVIFNKVEFCGNL